MSAERSVSTAAPSCDMTQIPSAASFNILASLAPWPTAITFSDPSFFTYARFCSCSFPPVSRVRGEVELLINDGLLPVRISSQQVNRDPVADGCDALGESIHQHAVHCQRAVHIADQMFQLQCAASGDADLDHYAHYTCIDTCFSLGYYSARRPTSSMAEQLHS